MNRLMENAVFGYTKELREHGSLTQEYENLYYWVESAQLRLLLSTVHRDLMSLLGVLNVKRNGSGHYPAEESRQLIRCIDMLRNLCSISQQTETPMQVESYYDEVLKNCRMFLQSSYGSDIPAQMAEVVLYYTMPVLISANNLSVSRSTVTNATLKLVGRGSYAEAYVFEDTFLRKKFIVKRALKTLRDDEVERFRRGFEVMKRLSSPYVAEVYRYEDRPVQPQYLMEYLDGTLRDYIKRNNDQLSRKERAGLVRQIFKAMQYLHTEGLLHRDLSPDNILLKKYDSCQVVKLSDFGLVKLPESQLTTRDTVMKGSFNDPRLEEEGFANYCLWHEMYALTLIVHFVMTGRENRSNIAPEWRDFVAKGMNAQKELRYKSVAEMRSAFEETLKKLGD